MRAGKYIHTGERKFWNVVCYACSFQNFRSPVCIYLPARMPHAHTHLKKTVRSKRRGVRALYHLLPSLTFSDYPNLYYALLILGSLISGLDVVRRPSPLLRPEIILIDNAYNVRIPCGRHKI